MTPKRHVQSIHLTVHRLTKRPNGSLLAADLWPDASGAMWRVALVGALAAVGVGYLDSISNGTDPAASAVLIRVVIIVTLIAAGAYAKTSKLQARMGTLLVAAGLYSSVWLLGGSSQRLAFSLGLLAGGLAPAVLSYLTLAHPTGSIRSVAEQRFLLVSGGLLMVFWVLLVLTRTDAPVTPPLLKCGSHCPHNIFFLGSTAPALSVLMWSGLVLAWIALACATSVLLARRVRATSAPLRRSRIAIQAAALLYAASLGAYFVLRTSGSNVANIAGYTYVWVAMALPLLILVGLAQERLFMGRALAEFVQQLARADGADPQALMATALHDPTLRIAYPGPAPGTYTDFSGTAVAAPERGRDRAVSWVEREGAPAAVVSYDAELEDQDAFIQAAGAAAILRQEWSRLESDLSASSAEVAASRIRLVEAADAERRRIERDIHDGIQQLIVGLRIKLDLAGQAVKADPDRGEHMIASIGRQMDDLLQMLRSLASGIYPSLLSDRGVGEALKSAARRAPVPVSVHAAGIGRYREEVEVAVYFCCLEALQNIFKHAGPTPEAQLHLQQRRGRLEFQVRDYGSGFDRRILESAHGVVNMSDRMQAVGGTVEVTSAPGEGTCVRGSVPIAPRTLPVRPPV